MKKLVYFLFVVSLATAAHAQQDTVTAVKANSLVGKDVFLCDRVKNGHMDNISMDEPTVVYVGDTYDTRTLALVFSKDVLRTFSFDPEKKMENHRFCVQGKIEMYEGKPAIYIKTENQLHVED